MHENSSAKEIQKIHFRCYIWNLGQLQQLPQIATETKPFGSKQKEYYIMKDVLPSR